MIKVMAVAFLCCFSAVSVWAGDGGPVRRDPLEKRIDLKLWGQDLSETISTVAEQANVDIIISGNFIHAKNFPRVKVLLDARNVSVRNALEFICRALGCRYYVEGPRTVRLSDSYDWMKEPLQVYSPTYTLDSMIARNETPREFEDMLWETVKLASIFGENVSMSLETDKVSPTETRSSLMAVLPKTLKENLSSALMLMNMPGEKISTSAVPAISNDEAELLKRLGNKIVVRYKGWTLKQAIEDITRQSGISIGFDHEPFRKRPLPKIDLDLREVTVKEALSGLAKAIGFSGFDLLPPNTVWLTEKGEAMRDAVSREFLWSNLEVKSYKVTDIAPGYKKAQVVIERLKQNAMPEIWLDAATSIVYQRKLGNLIVIAPEKAQRRVMVELAIIKREEEMKIKSSGGGGQ